MEEPSGLPGSRRQAVQERALAARTAAVNALAALSDKRIAGAHEAMLAVINEARAGVDAVEQQATTFDRLVADVPKRLDSAPAPIEQARSKVAAIAKLGFRVTEATAALDRADSALREAGEACRAKRLQATRPLP